MKTKLTDGRVIILNNDDMNPVGQVYLSKLVERGVAEDECVMAELLGAAPCDIRYGVVHPQVKIQE